jgi:hypothetical protein
MTEVQTEAGVLAGDERMLIDGELQFTGSGATFDVIHPASEEVAGRATDAPSPTWSAQSAPPGGHSTQATGRATSSSATTASPSCTKLWKTTKSGCAAS